MSSDLTFITNEAGQSLRDRFGVLLGDDTRFFDCLVGYFYLSGFYKLYPSLTQTEKIRILIGVKTDGKTYELVQEAKQQELVLESHAQARAAVAGAVRGELEKSDDTASVEDGIRKFVEWIASGKLEIKAFPSERIHSKLYIMTFHEDDRDKASQRRRRGIFAETRAPLNSSSVGAVYSAPDGAEKIFGFGCCKDFAPDGASAFPNLNRVAFSYRS